MGNVVRASAAALAVLTSTAFTAEVHGAPDNGDQPPSAVEMLVASDAAGIEIASSISDAAAQGGGRFNGKEVHLKRGISAYVSPNATLTQKHTSKLPVGPRGSLIPIETVTLAGGRVDFVMPERPTGGVLVESAGKIQTIVTSGNATIVEREGKVAVAALGGSLLVGKKGRFKPVLPGTIRVFDIGSGTFADRHFLNSPEARSSGLAVALEGSAPVVIQASRVAGASRYRATLVSPDGTVAGQSFESSTPDNIELHVPRAGTFWVVVRAIDEFGIAGSSSAPVSVQVLGLENGSEVVRHGMLFLSPGQSARVLGQEGLVMRYGTSPEFVPAPSALSLPGKKATTVEFRDPADPKRFAVFKLAPRLLRTRIEMGPQLGLWPQDDIDIRVRMWDGHGQPLSWMDEYRLVVKVGVEEVPVEWERQEGELRTVVAPQAGKGPWVLRVSVIDPTGHEIGRNFLEVISPKPKKKSRKTASK